MVRDVKPAKNPPIVHAFKVWTIVSFPNLFTTQKPESFGSERPIAPEHMAKPSRMGETPRSPAAGPKMLEVVTKATVAEPNDARKICEKIKANKSTGMFQLCIVSIRWSPIPLSLITAPKAPPAPVIKIIIPAELMACEYSC